MRAFAALLSLTTLASASAAEGPASQSLVFYNARIALREERPTDVLKLWLVRNSLEDRGQRSEHDPDFRSTVWAALGRLGLCQDGFRRDEEGGAGLWPLAQHNWLIDAMNRGPPRSRPAPFDAFNLGRQQRQIGLQDVLSSAELRAVGFHRGFCLSPNLSLLEFGQAPFLNLKDRLETGVLLKRLLYESRRTLAKAKVRNVSVVDARIFDLELALTELQDRKARRTGSVTSRQAKAVGLTEVGAAEAREDAARWPPGSAQAAFLKKALTWSADDWLSLSRQRRLFLFDQARRFSSDPQALERLELAIMDGLLDLRAGDELEHWIAFRGLQTREDRAAFVAGARGKRLLELEPDTGFRERATIALHRGVAFLEAGERLESLRAFAFAMQHAEASREAEVLLPLARRWTANVLSRYQTDEEVVATLRALVPRGEYNAVIEDLVWRAALRADRASFELLTRSYERAGGFEGKVTRLRPLSEGNAGALATNLRAGLTGEPYLTLRFIRQLIEQLEMEESEVRRANIPLLRRVTELLAEAAGAKGGPQAHQRSAEELLGRAEAILVGLDALHDSLRRIPRTLAPEHQTFAGSIRLAPSDPLPWPFTAPQTQAPSAFTPLLLQPVEWRDSAGALVFGWRITE